MLLEGSPGHNHVRHVLNAMVGLGGGPAANGQANNGHEIESAATATPSTSAAPLSAPSRGWHAIASPSPSVLGVVVGVLQQAQAQVQLGAVVGV